MALTTKLPIASTRVLLGAEEDPHEMGSEKGDVKIRRKMTGPQIVDGMARRTGRFSQLPHQSSLVGSGFKSGAATNTICSLTTWGPEPIDELERS